MSQKARQLIAAVGVVLLPVLQVLSATHVIHENTAHDHVKIVVTTFAIYDWTRQILGERLVEADLVLLQRGGVDLHSYSPSAADLRKIASCNLFVFVGGESDEWAERALVQQDKPNRRVLNLLKTLGSAVKDEESAEVMQHGHCHDKNHDHDGHAWDKDEHVWLSLRNAATIVKTIAANLVALDSANAATYRANAAAYRERLATLDGAYAKTVAQAARKTILVADRFPFRYLADDYGITYFAAFAGCSAESEASFKTIAFLAKKVDEFKLPVILTIEGTTHRIAETVRRTTKSRDQRILTLDSLQSIDVEAAKTTRYLDVMERNLEALKAALE